MRFRVFPDFFLPVFKVKSFAGGRVEFRVTTILRTVFVTLRDLFVNHLSILLPWDSLTVVTPDLIAECITRKVIPIAAV